MPIRAGKNGFPATTQLAMKQGDAVTAAAEMHQSRLRRQAGRRNQTAAPAASSAGGASMSPRYLVPAAMPKPAPASRNQPGRFRRAPVARKTSPMSRNVPVTISVLATVALRNTTPVKATKSPAPMADMRRNPTASAPEIAANTPSSRKKNW